MLVQKISSQIALANLNKNNNSSKARNEQVKMNSQPSFQSIPGLEGFGSDPVSTAITIVAALLSAIGAVAFIAAIARRGGATKAAALAPKSDLLGLGRKGNV